MRYKSSWAEMLCKYCKIVCSPHLILQCIKAFKYELKESVKVVRAGRCDKDIGVTAEKKKPKQELNGFPNEFYHISTK